MSTFVNEDSLVTYVANDEQQVIRALTDEEVVAVAGGMGPDLWE